MSFPATHPVQISINSHSSMANFYNRFLQSVERWPGVVAVEIQRHGGAVERHTYSQLRSMAESVGQWLIGLYGYGDKVDAFRKAYAEYGAWIILLKGLTPIPYKVVTITSGFADYNVFLFTFLSIIARGMRYYIVAFLLNKYGMRAREIIEKRLGLWVTLGAIVVFGGLVASVFLF